MACRCNRVGDTARHVHAVLAPGACEGEALDALAGRTRMPKAVHLRGVVDDLLVKHKELEVTRRKA